MNRPFSVRHITQTFIIQGLNNLAGLRKETSSPSLPLGEIEVQKSLFTFNEITLKSPPTANALIKAISIYNLANLLSYKLTLKLKLSSLQINAYCPYQRG